MNMMSHTDALEEFFSGKYVEDYLDFVESLPSELQRYLTRYREIDVDVQVHLDEISENRNLILNTDDSIIKERAIERIEHLLIGIQEMSDEKIDIAQELQDAIDRKYRELNNDYINLKNLVNDDYGETSNSENMSLGSSQGGNDHPPQTKKYRRNMLNKEAVSNIDQSHKDNKDGNTDSNIKTNLNDLGIIVPNASTSTSTTRKTHTGHRRRKRKGRTHFSVKDDSPNCDDELIGDPGEPTYCLCDQISFGEMILCDNDLCPHEWFHFSCVQLTIKPKGKWFCPKCRGDKPSVMKPKTMLLKALEKYNREREERIFESMK